MNNVIETENITKYYGKLAAVNKVSLNVSKGEIYGFLGLNGAGKTTMIKMLLGMIKPSEGKACINGHIVDAGNYKLWRDVGYMVEMPNSYPELTVYENLEIIRKLRNIKDKSATMRIIDRLALNEHVNKQAKALSLGNKQRLGIAKALIHLPTLLILDEPTNGLDPAGIVEIRSLLKEIAANLGVTILISSHLLGEISKTANRIGIIHKGTLINEFDSNAFEHLRRKKILIHTLNNSLAKEILIGNGYNVIHAESDLACADERAVMYPEKISELLVKNQCPPTSLYTESEDLETYFLRIITQGEYLS